jgi:hypothetical protein
MCVCALSYSMNFKSRFSFLLYFNIYIFIYLYLNLAINKIDFMFFSISKNISCEKMKKKFCVKFLDTAV